MLGTPPENEDAENQNRVCKIKGTESKHVGLVTGEADGIEHKHRTLKAPHLCPSHACASLPAQVGRSLGSNGDHKRDAVVSPGDALCRGVNTSVWVTGSKALWLVRAHA